MGPPSYMRSVVDWNVVIRRIPVVDSSRNVMTHGDEREGKWRGNWPMEGVDSTLTLRQNMVYPALLPLMCTPLLPVGDWTDTPADLNGLVRFAERRNLVSPRVPSHFNWPLQTLITDTLAEETRQLDTDITKYPPIHQDPQPEHITRFPPYSRSSQKKKTLFEWLPSQNFRAFLTSPIPAAFLAHNKFVHYKVFCATRGFE